jgi:hemolysin activation/secretion protein
LFVSFSSENSENLTNASLDNISTFQNYFLGFGYEYKVPKNDVFGNNTFYLNVNPSFGRRKTDTNSFQQIKITTTASYLLDFNTRHHIYFSNKTGLLNSESYLNNELFRIGGNKTIRGFKEQSLFVKNYILQNIEYRYNTSKNSYAYTITDLALISSEKENKKLYSLGLGYLFNTNTSQINISTAIGIDVDNPINLKNTLFFVNWISFF